MQMMHKDAKRVERSESVVKDHNIQISAVKQAYTPNMKSHQNKDWGKCLDSSCQPNNC